MPQFWTGKTGKEIRGDKCAQIVAFYLFTCPNANMIGLFYLPIPTLCHETGLTSQEVQKGLRRLNEVHYCVYDEISEHIWVEGMAAHQIGENLNFKDHKVKGVANELIKYVNSPFFNDFLDRYEKDFHINRNDFPEVPRKPLRSKEKEIEKEKDILKGSREREREYVVSPQNGNNGNQPKSRSGISITAKKPKGPTKEQIKELDEGMDLISWMAKQASLHRKGWKHSANKNNQGPTPVMQQELRGKEGSYGIIVRRWWINFMRSPQSNGHRYPYSEFLNNYLPEKIQKVQDDIAEREIAQVQAVAAEKRQLTADEDYE